MRCELLRPLHGSIIKVLFGVKTSKLPGLKTLYKPGILFITDLMRLWSNYFDHLFIKTVVRGSRLMMSFKLQ